MRIFLIDDEASARNSMERILRQVRPEAELAVFSRGQAALDAMTEGGFDEALRAGLDACAHRSAELGR